MKTLTLTLLVCSTHCFSAEDQKTKPAIENEATQKEAVLKIVREIIPQSAKSSNLKPRDTNTNLPSLTNVESWTGITVAAGQSLMLTSQSDWTGASSVAIAIECPSSVSLKNAGIAVWWGISLAPNPTLTDVLVGSSFFVPNMGGAVTSAFGNKLQLQLVNTGTVSISCDQVTAYGVVH